MSFQWDARKSIANREKHGIDFETAKALWLDENAVEVTMTFLDEKRWALIAAAQGRIWTAVYTMRGEAVRIISVRRARAKEAKLYEKKSIGQDGG